MSKLPTQLRWTEFVTFLKRHKLEKLPNKGGSARHFKRMSDGEIFTFHEPHGGDTIRQGTLTEYLRKLDLDRDQLERFQKDQGAKTIEGDLYKRAVDTDGTIISNCLKCLNVVVKSKLESEVLAAESAHTC